MDTETKLPAAEALAKNIEAQTAEQTAAATAHAAALTFTLAKTLDELEPKVEFGEVPADKQMFSLGYCCQLFQVAPPIVREIARRAEVRFACAVNDVPYLDGDGVVQMNRYLHKLRAEYEASE